MAFSLFFWRTKAQPTSLQPPPQPSAESVAPGMPFVRNQMPSTHPRLQRMAELLQQLPQPPNTTPHHSELDNVDTTGPQEASHNEAVAVASQIPAAPVETKQVLPPAPAWNTPARVPSAPVLPPMPSGHSTPPPAALPPMPVRTITPQPTPMLPPMPVWNPPPTPTTVVSEQDSAKEWHESTHVVEVANETTVSEATVVSQAVVPPVEFVMPAPPQRPPPALEVPVQQPARVVVIPPTYVEQRDLIEPDMVQRASNAFYAADGSVYWSVGEFADALVHMSEDTFAHHVSRDRNDFGNWIEGCFAGDTRLVGTLLHGLDRQGMIRLFLRLQRPPAPRIPVPHADEPHFDEKQPAVWEWTPPANTTPHSTLHELEDALKTAELAATHDVGAAREAFIHVRTRVWSELSDEERGSILPKMRAAYDRIKSIHQ